MRRAIILASIVAATSWGATACDSCDDHVAVVEVVPGEFGAALSRDIVRSYEQQGYRCVAEPLRNAFGARIGDRYTCTGCR